jgi:hypothetical protein
MQNLDGNTSTLSTYYLGSQKYLTVMILSSRPRFVYGDAQSGHPHGNLGLSASVGLSRPCLLHPFARVPRTASLSSSRSLLAAMPSGAIKASPEVPCFRAILVHTRACFAMTGQTMPSHSIIVPGVNHAPHMHARLGSLQHFMFQVLPLAPAINPRNTASLVCMPNLCQQSPPQT